jgi:hypothetical protein
MTGQGSAELIWPDCGFAAEDHTIPSRFLAGCAGEIGANESLYEGVVMEADFMCAEPGMQAVTLAHGIPLDSNVLDDTDLEIPVADSADAVTIECTPDTDHDGCTDVQDGGASPISGGVAIQTASGTSSMSLQATRRRVTGASPSATSSRWSPTSAVSAIRARTRYPHP